MHFNEAGSEAAAQVIATELLSIMRERAIARP